ncbi:MAG: heavy metal translocating P-type ATPase, partial [Roseobacter sp.]
LGDTVSGGTINGSGSLKLRATRVGDDTLLSGIIRMVQEAQGAKLPIQALVDRITLWFVPVVLAIAAVTVVIWVFVGPAPVMSYALVAGVSVLIIACPCAMGLATPTSIMVATGRAAELGVLFRKGDALQSLSAAQMIAFDKTGTLTEGKPVLSRFVAAPGQDRSAVLRKVAAVESRAEHPLGTALVQAAQDEGLVRGEASAVQAQTGLGIAGHVEGTHVLIGSERLMQSEGIDLSGFDAAAMDAATLGETVFFAAIDSQAAAMICITDPVKPNAAAIVRSLHHQGVGVAMITGDRAETAAAIANKIGIETVIAGVMPSGKVDAIADLQKTHGPVCFVGDGINDGPALAAADVGVAIGTGTDVAIQSADVVLMSGDLSGVVTARHISKQAMRNIRQNLFWAFGYNTALVPVAAGVLFAPFGIMLSPMLAAGAMALSSVFVLTNALRLKGLRQAGL